MFTLQTLPASEEPFDGPVGQVAGFSLHAGVAAKAHQRQKLERLCRYISRPAVSEQRLSLTPNGNVRYQLKTPYRDGTTHVIFEPLDFLARLAALVPKPRVNPGSSPGQALGAAAQTRLWHRQRDLSGLRRAAADHRLHRRPRGDQEDSRSPREEGRLRSTLPVAALSGATAGEMALINGLPPDPQHRC